MTSFLVEPVMLIGEGKYNLDALKEIKVTESYAGMNMKVRGCQTEKPLEDCTTRHHTETIIQQCGCLPLRLSSFKMEHVCMHANKHTVW